MAYNATETITVNSVAKVLNRIREEGYSSEYRLIETDGVWKMFVRHSERKDPSTGEIYYRHNVEFQHIVNAAGGVPARTRKWYYVYDVPQADSLVTLGYEAAAFGNIAAGATHQTDLLNYMS